MQVVSCCLDAVYFDTFTKHSTNSLSCNLEPRWIVDQEIKRRLDEYEGNEREIKERLEFVRKEKQRKMEEMKRRATFARKRQVRTRSIQHVRL